jgi:hypothetical protein
MRRLPKEKLNAVYDDDLEAYLEKLGVLGAIHRGKMKCKFCRMPVTLANLHSLFPESGSVKVVCDKAVELTNILQVPDFGDHFVVSPFLRQHLSPLTTTRLFYSYPLLL